MSDGFSLETFLNADSLTSSNSLFQSSNFKVSSQEETPILDSIPTKQTAKIENDTEFYQELNREILTQVRESISEQKFRAFFEKNFSLVQLAESVARFQTTTPFIKSIVLNHHLDLLKSILFNLMGNDYQIEITIGSTQGKSLSSNQSSILKTLTKESEVTKVETPKREIKSVKDIKFTLDSLTPTPEDRILEEESRHLERIEPVGLTCTLDPEKTFHNFVVGPCNKLARETAYAIANNPGSRGSYPCLYLYSGSGLGKTHLLHAIGNLIEEQFQGLTVYLTSAKELMDEMVEAFRGNKLNEFHDKYATKIDVLMIDDIHDLKNRQGLQDQFFHIFNEFHKRGKQLIFTSDQKPSDIDGIKERIRTRLQWGLVIDIDRPDYETRLAILKNKSVEQDLFLPDEVFGLIASLRESSVRELEGDLNKLKAYHSIMNTEIDYPIAKEILKVEDNGPQRKIDLEKIAKTVANYFHLSIQDLKSKSRQKRIAYARHIAIYLASKLGQATTIDIGQYFNRNHSTVSHSLKTTKESLSNDARLNKDLIYLEQNC